MRCDDFVFSKVGAVLAVVGGLVLGDRGPWEVLKESCPPLGKPSDFSFGLRGQTLLLVCLVTKVNICVN